MSSSGRLTSDLRIFRGPGRVSNAARAADRCETVARGEVRDRPRWRGGEGGDLLPEDPERCGHDESRASSVRTAWPSRGGRAQHAPKGSGVSPGNRSSCGAQALEGCEGTGSGRWSLRGGGDAALDPRVILDGRHARRSVVTSGGVGVGKGPDRGVAPGTTGSPRRGLDRGVATFRGHELRRCVRAHWRSDGWQAFSSVL
jgi:hypothetical protein